MKISAFADCNSESVIIRVPYELAVALIKNCPPTEGREELIHWLKIAAARSKKFSKLLEENDEDNEL